MYPVDTYTSTRGRPLAYGWLSMSTSHWMIGICHNRTMPRRSSMGKDHDFATVARRVVEQAIGETLTGEPLPDPNAGKNPAAVALGKLGGARREGGESRKALAS